MDGAGNTIRATYFQFDSQHHVQYEIHTVDIIDGEVKKQINSQLIC
jgi:hypothetical protein